MSSDTSTGDSRKLPYSLSESDLAALAHPGLNIQGDEMLELTGIEHNPISRHLSSDATDPSFLATTYAPGDAAIDITAPTAARPPVPNSPPGRLDSYHLHVQEPTPVIEPYVYQSSSAARPNSILRSHGTHPTTTSPGPYIATLPSPPNSPVTESGALPPSPGGGNLRRRDSSLGRRPMRYTLQRHDSGTPSFNSVVPDDPARDFYGFPHILLPTRLGFEARNPFHLRANAPQLLRRVTSQKSKQDLRRTSTIRSLEGEFGPDWDTAQDNHDPPPALGDVAEGSEIAHGDPELLHPPEVDVQRDGIQRHTSWMSDSTMIHPQSGIIPHSDMPFVPSNMPASTDVPPNPTQNPQQGIYSSDTSENGPFIPNSPRNSLHAVLPVPDTPETSHDVSAAPSNTLKPVRKAGEPLKVSPTIEAMKGEPGPEPEQYKASRREFVLSFIFRYGWITTAGIYSICLLHLPSLYCSRVSKIFEEAQLSIKQLEIMALEMGTADGPNRSEIMFQAFSDPESLHPSIKFLAFSWEKFVDGLIKEWKTLNIISALLLSAILTLLQIPGAEQDPITKYIALYSLLCALSSLVYGCIYIIRFNTMREPSKAVEWAAQAEGQKGPNTPEVVIWWNVWVLLAMPAVWLTWSLILYVAAVMSFVWRSGTLDPSTHLSTGALLGVRIFFSVTLLLAIIYGTLIVSTFRQYGEVMDDKWKKRVQSYLSKKKAQATPSLRSVATNGTSSSGYGNPVLPMTTAPEFLHPNPGPHHYMSPYIKTPPGQLTELTRSPYTNEHVELPSLDEEQSAAPPHLYEAQNVSPRTYPYYPPGTTRPGPVVSIYYPRLKSSKKTSPLTRTLNLNATSAGPSVGSHPHRRSMGSVPSATRKDPALSPGESERGVATSSGVGMPRSQSIPIVPTGPVLPFHSSQSEGTRVHFQPFTTPDISRLQEPLPDNESPHVNTPALPRGRHY